MSDIREVLVGTMKTFDSAWKKSVLRLIDSNLMYLWADLTTPTRCDFCHEHKSFVCSYITPCGLIRPPMCLDFITISIA